LEGGHRWKTWNRRSPSWQLGGVRAGGEVVGAEERARVRVASVGGVAFLARSTVTIGKFDICVLHQVYGTSPWVTNRESIGIWEHPNIRRSRKSSLKRPICRHSCRGVSPHGLGGVEICRGARGARARRSRRSTRFPQPPWRRPRRVRA
jgi:hypothetical protein